jgi:hypothetical protein
VAVNLRQHAVLWKDMAPHVATLQRLARGKRSIVEFGVRTGVSTWAILDAMPRQGHLTSLDNGWIEVPERVRNDPRWTYVAQDSAHPSLYESLPKSGLVFIDTNHEYHHTLEELAIAAHLEAKTIALHDWTLPDVHDAVLGFCSRRPYQIVGIEPSEWGFVWLGRR